MSDPVGVVQWLEVKNKDFRGERVLLDCFRFINCTFTDCIFEFRGTEWSLIECTINEPFFVDFKGYANSSLQFLDYIHSLDKNIVRNLFPHWFT